jgi:V/A-type H+-transporting ATPase subunit A
VNEVSGWWDKTTGEEWLPLRYMMMDLLQKEQRLQQVVKLVGPDVLPDTQKLILEICAMFKNAFLQQSAFDEIDTYSSARKQFLMLKAIVSFYRAAEQLVKQGVGLSEVRASPVYQDILRMKTRYTEYRLDELEKTVADIDKSLKNLEV